MVLEHINAHGIVINPDLHWSDLATAAFNSIKNTLANASLLSYPMSNALTRIMTDALFQQYIDSQWHLIC